MILVESLIRKLNKSKIDFFTGVPDSVLKPFQVLLKITNIKIMSLLLVKDQLFQ